MKHPIIYRSVFYSILVLLVGTIMYLLSFMNDAPYRSSDMRLSFYYGCNYGARPLDDAKVDDCLRAADLYKNTLDDLDRQMEKLSEQF